MRAGRATVTGVTERNSTPSAVTYSGLSLYSSVCGAPGGAGGTGGSRRRCTFDFALTSTNVPLPSSSTSIGTV